MPTISGSLNLVTDRPVDSISEVWVRARETRGQGDGLVVGVNDRVPVTGGAVEFTALPGAAVLVLVQNGMPLETLPMLVGDEAQQSLRLVVQAGQVAGSADKSVIEQLAAEIAASVTLAEQYRTEAASSASSAQSSKTAAATSASKAKTSETNAKTSETNSKTSETNAANSAASAESQQKSAWTHFNNTVAEAEAAAASASAAETSETNAASSASASASSASSSETQAGKSATSASQAASARDAAKTSETNAAGSAAAAKTSETNAAQSSSSANTHRAAATEQATAASESATQAGAARDAAQASQSAAKTSENNAASHEQAAALSESNAAVHETHAEESATAAAGSATEAKGHADRAEQMADPDGLRDEITQQLADLVDGAPEDLDTIREVAEYAQGNRDITDQLNAAIGNKADKSHTHTWSSITNRPDIPVTDVGYRIRWADHAPNLYPAGVSVSMSATEQGWGTALAAGNPDYVDDGFVVILTIRNGRYDQSATQMVFSYTNVTRPVYIRKYNGEASGWSNFRKLSDDGHKHVSSEISDALNTSNGYGTGTHGRLVAWGGSGEIRRTHSSVRPPPTRTAWFRDITWTLDLLCFQAQERPPRLSMGQQWAIGGWTQTLWNYTRSRGFKLAITSELIGKLGGGGDIETIPVGKFTGTDLVIYSFTLDEPSVVSAALTGIQELEGGTNRWGPPAPSIEVRPPGGGVWGETQFGASLMVHSESSNIPPESWTGNARYLSVSAVLPPGDYEIVINSQSDSRTCTVETATIVTTPL